MANRTVKDANSIKGTNPQYLVEKILRSRIYDSRYWKEECFALTAELLVDKAMELKFIGGVFGGNIKPTPFLCLVLKMLQIQPEKDIIVEFIKNEDFKYVRALGAYYMRLVGTSLDCYKYLEPLYNDYRKLKRQKRDGVFELIHLDEFIDELLHDERVCDIILPRIQKRQVLEENNELEPRVSALEDDLDEVEESDEEDIKESSKPKVLVEKHRSYRDLDRPRRSLSPKFRRSRSPHKRRSKSPSGRRHSRERHKPHLSSSRGRAAKRHRSRSKSPGGHRHQRERDEEKYRQSHREHRGERRSGRSQKSGVRDRDRDRERDRGNDRSGGGSSKEDPEIAEANALRAKLGMAPLRA